MLFTQREIEVLKELLIACSDEELFEIFHEVYDTVKEKLEKIKKRPPAVYSNHSPYGIADELHRGFNSSLKKFLIAKG